MKILTLNFLFSLLSASFLPQGDKDTPICGASKITCYEDAEDKLIENGLIEGFKNAQTAGTAGNICNCLPACTSITYDARISQAQFESKDLLTAFDDGTENPFIGYARNALFEFIRRIASILIHISLYFQQTTLPIINLLRRTSIYNVKTIGTLWHDR